MEHIFWSFLLYVLYVLLPILPAVIIYRMFPKSRATASGPLGEMKIKVGGAFGAYVITVLLGYHLVSKIDEHIGALSEPTWRLRAEVALHDDRLQPIPDPDSVIRDLKFVLEPPLDSSAYPHISIRLPLVKPEEWPIVRLRLPGFQEKPINLRAELDSNRAMRDNGKRIITLRDPLILQQSPSLKRPYVGDEPALAPLADGPPNATSDLASLVCLSLPRDHPGVRCVTSQR